MRNQDIYNAAFVRALFDEMSRTYGIVNVVSSFGFCVRWRRQCVDGIAIAPDSTVCDLMSGMGELWPSIARRLTPAGRIAAVDFSPVMTARARTRARRPSVPIEILTDDALASSIPNEAADAVVSSFGLKTFDREQLRVLANEVARVLRPGGRLSFVEMSVPPPGWLRALYMFYVRRVIPVIGRLLLGKSGKLSFAGRVHRAVLQLRSLQPLLRRRRPSSPAAIALLGLRDWRRRRTFAGVRTIMFFVSRPSLARIEQFLKESADLPLSYSPVGLAAQSPAGFTVGESVVTVGQGRAAFDRAESALQAWRHYDIGWVELFPRAASVKPGSVVAVLIRHLGIWSLNGCRVLYTLGAHGSGESYGFAYGTLTNHAESGEEVFEIARDPRSDEVTYRIRGVARPQSFLARAGQPIVRLLQAKFRRDSGEAFRAALNGGSR